MLHPECYKVIPSVIINVACVFACPPYHLPSNEVRLHKNTRLTRVCNKQCYYSKYSNCQPSRNLVPRVLSPLLWRDHKVLIRCKEKCASASRYLILYYFISYNIRACQRRNLRQRCPENYAWLNT